MIPKQKKLVAINADIRGMIQAIKDFKARRKSAIEANDYETAEQMWSNEKAMAKNLAEANTRRLNFITPRQMLSMKIRSLQSAACLDLLA